MEKFEVNTLTVVRTGESTARGRGQGTGEGRITTPLFESQLGGTVAENGRPDESLAYIRAGLASPRILSAEQREAPARWEDVQNAIRERLRVESEMRERQGPGKRARLIALVLFGILCLAALGGGLAMLAGVTW